MSIIQRLIVVLLILGGLVGIYTLIEPYLLMYKEVTIKSPNIPEAFNNTKIVFITDIQYAPIIPSENGQKYRTGSLEINSMKVITSNGLGTVTPPVRFFARPQIIVATLESGE